MNIYELSQMAFIGGQDKVDAKCKSLIGDPEDTTSVSYVLALADSLNTAISKQTGVLDRLNQFQKDYEPRFRELSLKMANTQEITFDLIPPKIKINI